MGALSAHLATAILSMYCLSLLGAIAFAMAAQYVLALHGCCGPTTRAQGSFSHRNSRGLVLRAHDFQRLEAAVGIHGCDFRLLLIILTPGECTKVQRKQTRCP